MKGNNEVNGPKRHRLLGYDSMFFLSFHSFYLPFFFSYQLQHAKDTTPDVTIPQGMQVDDDDRRMRGNDEETGPRDTAVTFHSI